MEELKKKLKLLADKNMLFDNEDATVYDYCGGNMDDAYERGCVDGQIALARELIGDFFNEV